MRRKIGIALMLVILISGVSISAASRIAPWNLFRKEKGVVVAQNGQHIKEPTSEEKAEYASSWNPVTSLPAKHLENTGFSNIVSSVKINIQEQGAEEDLSLDYVEQDDNYAFFIPPGISGRIVPVPNKQMHFLEYGNSIYAISNKSMIAKPLLKDQSHGYDRKDTLGHKEMYWGANISVSPDGNHAIFLTNRWETKPTYERATEIWYKNLDSGEEYPLPGITYNSVLTWKGSLVFVEKPGTFERDGGLWSMSSIVAIDVVERELKVVAQNITSCAASYPYAVAYTIDHDLVVINLDNGSTRKVDGLKHDFFGRMMSTQDSEYALIFAMPNRMVSPATDLIVLNLESLDYRILAGNEQTVYERYQFVDPNTILLTVRSTRVQEEETYIIDLREWR